MPHGTLCLACQCCSMRELRKPVMSYSARPAVVRLWIKSTSRFENINISCLLLGHLHLRLQCTYLLCQINFWNSDARVWREFRTLNSADLSCDEAIQSSKTLLQIISVYTSLNVWRSIRKQVTDHPLAFAESASVAKEDLVKVTHIYDDQIWRNVCSQV